MVIRRIWSERREATTKLAPKKKGELRPGGHKPPLIPLAWAIPLMKKEAQTRNIV